MAATGKAILFALAFAAALVAITLGLRKVRDSRTVAKAGPLASLRRAFWMAVATILGGSGLGCAGRGREGPPRPTRATSTRERVLPAQAGEAREVPVRRVQGRRVFDRQCCDRDQCGASSQSSRIS